MPTGAELFVEGLKAGGVDTVYGVPGEETTALMQAITDQGLAFVLCRHEQAAAFMASVHGRLTGRPAVCLATLGPGATNLVTGVADATLDYAPLIAVTGQGGLARMGRESHQMLDLAALFQPVTKRSRTILDADQIPGFVAEGIRIATEPRPGAVHLSLPEDIAHKSVDRRIIAPVPRRAASPDAAAIAVIADAIRAAANPVILCGAGVVRSGSSDAVGALAQACNLPLATSFMAKGVLSGASPHFIGTFGQPDDTPVDAAIRSADLIVTIGLDPVEYPPAQLTRCGHIPTASLAEVAMPRDAGWRIVAEAVGDLPVVVARLETALAGSSWNWTDAMQAARDWNPLPGRTDPEVILTAINDTLAPDDIVLSGVGNHKMWIAQGLAPNRAGQLIIPNGLAGMGLAVPGAIAAARLFPDRRVLAICGDGDVMMNVQDFETAARLNLDLTVLVWVDGAYGLIEKKHHADTGQKTKLRFGPVDWQSLAAAFGWMHRACETAALVGDTLQGLRGVSGCHLVSVGVRYPDMP